MTWVRLDDDYPNHPKLLKAGPIAELIQVRALCYASHHLTNGFIPTAAVPALLLGLKDVAIDYLEILGAVETATGALDFDWPSHMVLHALWTQDPRNEGYWIHDYLDYQPSKRDVLNTRKTTRIRVSTWRERNAYRNGVTNGVSNSPVTASPDPDPDLRNKPPKSPLALPSFSEPKLPPETGQHSVTLAMSDAWRHEHRNALRARGLTHTQADTEAGKIVAAEVVYYRQHGIRPAPPTE